MWSYNSNCDEIDSTCVDNNSVCTDNNLVGALLIIVDVPLLMEEMLIKIVKYTDNNSRCADTNLRYVDLILDMLIKIVKCMLIIELVAILIVVVCDINISSRCAINNRRFADKNSNCTEILCWVVIVVTC